MFDLRPHQEEAIAKMHNGCILCGGTGVGKSHTAVGYYLNNEAPKPVYVITTAKKRDKGDWQTLWAEVGMHKDPELTMGAVVVVDSWENIKKYREVTDAFFIFDEQRLVGTGAWVKAFYKIAANNRWIMLSATPGDNWLDYVPVFRANGFIKNITQFKEDHVLTRWTGRYHQVTGYRQVPKLVKWRNQLLVDMPYDRHTTRHSHDVLCTYDTATVRKLVKERWHVLENRPLQDASELFRVMRKVVYTDSSRLEAVRMLLNSHPKLIVFYNFDYELEILRTLAKRQSQTDWTAILQPKWELTGTSTQTSQPIPEMQSDWEWLLSPEGMAANALIGGATSDSETLTSSSSTTERNSVTFTPTTSKSFSVAEWNGHKHEEIPKTDSWVYLVQYVAGAEAWETVETDAICFYSMPYSYKLWHQAHGRIDRLSTSFLDLHYYRLISDAVIEQGVSESLRVKKSFNESAFIEKTEIWQN